VSASPPVHTVVTDSGSGKSGIWPFFGNTAPAKFLAGFRRYHCRCSTHQLITDKTNASDLSCGVFCNFSWCYSNNKNTKSISVQEFRQKLDAMKQLMNCTVSLLQLTALLMPLYIVSSGVLFSDSKTSSPQIWIRLWPDRPRVEFLNPDSSGSAGFEIIKSGTYTYSTIFIVKRELTHK